VDRTTHYGWMKNDPEYRKSFEEAREEAYFNRVSATRVGSKRRSS